MAGVDEGPNSENAQTNSESAQMCFNSRIVPEGPVIVRF